jgi:hypothetical protein
MIYEIQYGDRVVEIKALSDLSFEEYNYILKVLADDKYSTVEQYQEILLTLTDLTPEEILLIKDITKIDLNTILSQQIISKNFKNKFNDYNLININKIPIGRFIDLEYFLLSDTIDDKVETIIALMYIDIDFDEKSLENLKKDVKKKMKIGEALQIMKIFTDFRDKIYKDYEGLFQIVSADEDSDSDEDIEISPENEGEYDNNQEEDDDNSSESWGLMEYVYYLCNDNILEVDKILEKNIFEVFNFLSWKKQKNDEEKAREKQNNMRNY